MRYWWLNFGENVEEQIEGAFVALPLRDSVGVSKSSWTRLKEVQPGDLVFAFGDQMLISIVVAHATAERARLESANNRPYQALVLPGPHFELPEPIAIDEFRDDIADAFDAESQPWEREPARHGEIHSMPKSAGDHLLKLFDLQEEDTDRSLAVDVMVEALRWGDLPDETVETLIAARFGVGRLYNSVMTLFDNKCCVSGLATPELLQIHHIKFWLYADNDERLDPHNALLLAPTYRSAFMRGLISFDDVGKCLVSELLDPGDATRLGLHMAPALPIRSDRQRAYLAWHRGEIFRT